MSHTTGFRAPARARTNTWASCAPHIPGDIGFFKDLQGKDAQGVQPGPAGLAQRLPVAPARTLKSTIPPTVDHFSMLFSASYQELQMKPHTSFLKLPSLCRWETEAERVPQNLRAGWNSEEQLVRSSLI